MQCATWAVIAHLVIAVGGDFVRVLSGAGEVVEVACFGRRSTVGASGGSGLVVYAQDLDLGAAFGCAGHGSDVALGSIVDEFEVGTVCE